MADARTWKASAEQRDSASELLTASRMGAGSSSDRRSSLRASSRRALCNSCVSQHTEHISLIYGRGDLCSGKSVSLLSWICAGEHEVRLGTVAAQLCLRGGG